MTEPCYFGMHETSAFSRTSLMNGGGQGVNAFANERSQSRLPGALASEARHLPLLASLSSIAAERRSADEGPQ